MSERPQTLSERLDLKYWAFRALAAITPLAPLWLAQRVAIVAGTLAWAFAAPLRRRAARNLRHVPGLAADPARLRRATRGAFIHLALNYLDFFRGRFVTNEELSRGWTIHGWDTFERAIREGRGAIVLGAHMGPFEYSMAKLGEMGHPLLTPAERLRPERFFQLVSRIRDHHQARLLPADERETLRELLSSLRQGQMVMFAIDRWVTGPSEDWPLFGEPARLPTAPFALAARSESPVFLIVPWRVGLKRIEATAELITPERLPPEGSAPASAASENPRDRRAATTEMRQRVYPLLERIIAAHPEQWVSVLATVWDFPPAQAPQAQATANESGARQTLTSAHSTPAKSVAGQNQ